MSKVRVCVLFTSGQIGGAERSLTRMVVASNRSALPVDYKVATLGNEGAWSAWARSLGLAALTFGARSSKDGVISVKALWRTVAWLRQAKPDVVYVIGIRAALYLRLLRPLLGNACIVHGIRSNYVPGSRWFLPLRRIERLLGRWVDLYIANSRAGGETLYRWMGVPRSKLRFIPNGIAMPSEPAKVSGNAPIAITVANISPVKNHSGYISAIAEIVEQTPDARFHFVGRDDMNGVVQRHAEQAGLQQAISFFGHRDDVDELLKHARVFVLPSLHEGMPTSVLEAMAHGLPVVGFAIESLEEIVSPGITGMLVPAGDHSALAQAVLHYLQNASDAEKAGAAGRARVKEQFTLHACAQAHADVFRQLKRCDEHSAR